STEVAPAPTTPMIAQTETNTPPSNPVEPKVIVRTVIKRVPVEMKATHISQLATNQPAPAATVEEPSKPADVMISRRYAKLLHNTASVNVSERDRIKED